MSRTMTITLEVALDHLPLAEIDNLDEIARDLNHTPEQTAAAILAEAEDYDVAECLLQGIFEPGNFAGSGMYLKVADAKIVGMKWQESQQS